jgi:hypothetical protein
LYCPVYDYTNTTNYYHYYTTKLAAKTHACNK